MQQLLGSLCPACSADYQSTPSGLCVACAIEHARERYVSEDHKLAYTRHLGWKERTTRPDADLATLRQQRHRLQERCRPREPATSADPLVIAEEALQALHDLKPTLGRNPGGSTRLEVVEEALRRLAWGPMD